MSLERTQPAAELSARSQVALVPALIPEAMLPRLRVLQRGVSPPRNRLGLRRVAIHRPCNGATLPRPRVACGRFRQCFDWKTGVDGEGRYRSGFFAGRTGSAASGISAVPSATWDRGGVLATFDDCCGLT